MGIIDDILDFLAFIILLGVAIAISFNVIIPEFKESQIIPAVFVDKSAPERKGYDFSEPFDGTYSKMEVVLFSQVQDNEIPLPTPKRYFVGGTVGGSGATRVDVPSDYRADLQSLGVITYNAIRGESNSYRYKVDFNYGASSSSSDDIFQIRQVR